MEMDLRRTTLPKSSISVLLKMDLRPLIGYINVSVCADACAQWRSLNQHLQHPIKYRRVCKMFVARSSYNDLQPIAIYYIHNMLNVVLKKEPWRWLEGLVSCGHGVLCT